MKHFFKFMAVSLCVLGMSGFEASAKVSAATKGTVHHVTQTQKKTKQTANAGKPWKAPAITSIVYVPSASNVPGGYPVSLYFNVKGTKKEITVPTWVALNIVDRKHDGQGIVLHNGHFLITTHCAGCGSKSEIKEMEKVFKQLQALGYRDTAINVVASKTNGFLYSQLTSK